MANELRRWEPFQEMISLREAMDRLFEESLVRPFGQSTSALADNQLAVDIYKDKDQLVVKAAVPGIDPDDLDISISGDVLKIQGETKSEKEVKQENYHRREFRHGAFGRSVRLPAEVDSTKAEATVKDGILTLSFPLSEKAKPKAIAVQVKK
jgi:HSP20 family protein